MVQACLPWHHTRTKGEDGLFIHCVLECSLLNARRKFAPKWREMQIIASALNLTDWWSNHYWMCLYKRVYQSIWFFTWSRCKFHFVPNLWIDDRCFKLILHSSPAWVFDARICFDCLVFGNRRWLIWCDLLAAKRMNKEVRSNTCTSGLIDQDDHWEGFSMSVRWLSNF